VTGAALALLLTACRPAARPPSFVLVSLDTLRADRLGLYGDAEAVSPTLDALAAESVVFERAWAQANVTHMSHAALFSGRYPSELGPTSDAFFPTPTVPLLAEVLGTFGWQTAASVGGGNVTAQFGLDRGFATFERPAALGSLYHTVPVALARLDALDAGAPYLMFVHGYDTHVRYLKPGPLGRLHLDPRHSEVAERALRDPLGTSYVLDGLYYEGIELTALLDMRPPQVWGAEARAALPERAAAQGAAVTELSAADLAAIGAAYAGAVTYMDAWLGLLLAGLEQRGALDEAWLVVLSDHGESLGEDGFFGHNLALTDATLRVPLLVRPPGGLPGGARVEVDVALLDVLPTILELAQIHAPAGVHGRSLAPALRGEAVAGRAVTFAEGPARMVSARSAAGRLTFQGLAADAPCLGELVAVAALPGPAFAPGSPTDPAAREALRGALVDWRAGLHLHGGARGASPAAVEAMRARGYWGDP